MGFRDKIIAQRGHLIRKLSYTNADGDRKFCFLMLDKEKEKSYFQRLKDDPYNNDWSEYGEIIRECDGDQADEESIAYMIEHYGFERENLLVEGQE